MHRTNGDAMLCATQEMKKFLMDKFEQPRVYTIHEAMGGTYDRVHIITTDIDKIHINKVTYVYTAMSRTTDTLVMYGNEEQIQNHLSFLSAPSRFALLPKTKPCCPPIVTGKQNEYRDWETKRVS